MSDRPSAESPAPAQLSERDLDDVAGGLIPAVIPATVAATPVATSSQPVLPAVQRSLIGLL